MKLSCYEAGDRAFSDHFRNHMLAYFFGEAGEMEDLEQVTPDPNLISPVVDYPFNEVYVSRGIDGEEGMTTFFKPSTYVKALNKWSSQSDGHRFMTMVHEMHAYRKKLLEVDGHHFQGPRHILNNGDNYEVQVFNGATPIDPSDYTIDYARGLFTFVTDRTTQKIKFSGYHYVKGINYKKGSRRRIYYDWGLESTRRFSIIPVLNPLFELWDDSVTLKEWTTQGTVQREGSAQIQGLYSCKMTASAGSACYIKQEVTIPESNTVDRATLVVVLRTTNKALIKISMDDEASYDQAVFTASSDQQNKYVILVVQNATLSTTNKIWVYVSPQETNSDSGIVHLEQVELITGGLM